MTTADDAERIREVRAGLAAAGHDRRLRDRGRDPGAAQLRRRRGVRRRRLRRRPSYISTLETSTPIADHVPVDFELHGCPVDRYQLLEVVSAFLAERRPQIPDYSVCVECKRRGNVCVMVAHGTACLGPVTHAGCGAICPAHDRGCYGCFGPMESPNAESLSRWLRGLGAETPDLIRPYRTFNAAAPAFREAGDARCRGGRPAALTREATSDAPDRDLRAGPGRGRGRDARADPRRGGARTSSCGSTSRRASSRRCCAAAALEEAPDITARICGICPVAYQTSACQAMEDALGIEVDGQLRACAG